MKPYPLLLALLLVAAAPLPQAEGSVVTKTYCAQATGYPDLETLKTELLLGAKRLAVNELFGELIAASTAVKDSVVTSDQIRASSIGFVRLEGNVEYRNGDNFAEVCATIRGYATPQDREQFKPVKLIKRNCVSNPKLTPRELRGLAHEEVILKALEDFEPKLKDQDREKLLRLMRRVRYLESGLVPDTDTYCARVEGEVVPIEVKALLELDATEPAPEPTPPDAAATGEAAPTVTATAPATATVGSGQVLQLPDKGKLRVPFADPANPMALSGLWKWAAGDAPENRYRISGDGAEVTLISGGQTNFWERVHTAPQLSLPLQGDFEVEVRLDFDPRERWQVGGLAIRSQEDPLSWIGLRRFSDGNGQIFEIIRNQKGAPTQLFWMPYSRTTIFFRIIRREELWSFALSENGENWLTVRANELFALPDRVEAVLHLYSTTPNGTLGRFSQFTVGKPGTPYVHKPAGAVPFAAADKPKQLSPIWGYTPGGSLNNALRVEQGKLTLTAGSPTGSYDGDRTAPFVALPVSGNFTARVQLDFDPSGRNVVAGFAIRSLQEPAQMVSLRRYSGGDQGQYVDVLVPVDGYRTLTWQNFSQKTVHFQIQRSDPLLTLSFSNDGKTWTPLAVDYVKSFADPVTLMLYVWSGSGYGTSATFSNLVIEPRE
ncbi:MAG: DUF1349 domain-containing protein [Anaerolineae bacterium]|nr:DUF1349 domain-containing protein [Thermoflexales bacterium]MDW8408083.1 DUF1349 domain-containing protein [Anaerolineae bacterium]